MPQNNCPVSVVIATKNEAPRIAACLAALSSFDDLWVIDSGSTDHTAEIAAQHGAKILNFTWDGRYPKKRQWILDHVPLAHPYVFFVDADEIVPPALVAEIAALDGRAAGYFITGTYTFDGKMLRHGLRNKKLALFDRHKFEFPVVDDLDIPGMGEIEGHYQPVFKPAFVHEALGALRTPLLHTAYDDAAAWEARHRRYAAWEARMNAKNAWPQDPAPLRQIAKQIFRSLPCRGLVAFVHSYIFKGGFLDGAAGYHFARSRARYYRMVRDLSRQ